MNTEETISGEIVKQTDKENSISQNFENITGSYVGSNNVYCNVPEFLLENQQDYIELLKKEIQQLKEKIAQLEQK
ncbi:hypothetical protein [Chryseobacterium sp. IHB B 17019]|jgi:hypothetical protein|uniref:hypothetical protein n=1 Tax=Chryseobacterium sp. IHB B 17019 TaxID=1721091 RepID=UPI00161DD703|nr:hypothetical protein [Chryseobacterium sp. IHB B 17019]